MLNMDLRLQYNFTYTVKILNLIAGSHALSTVHCHLHPKPWPVLTVCLNELCPLFLSRDAKQSLLYLASHILFLLFHWSFSIFEAGFSSSSCFSSLAFLLLLALFKLQGKFHPPYDMMSSHPSAESHPSSKDLMQVLKYF